MDVGKGGVSGALAFIGCLLLAFPFTFAVIGLLAVLGLPFSFTFAVFGLLGKASASE